MSGQSGEAGDDQRGSQGAARPAAGAPHPTGLLSAEAVAWGFRLLAGREASSDAEFAAFQALPDVDAMRRAFTNTDEFHAFFDSVLEGFPTYSLPLFMLRPTQVEGLEWRFEPPLLDQPGCQLCTASQFAEPAFLEIVEAMGLPPGKARGQWEQAWIVSVLATAGLIAPGRRGLGLQVWRERVAAVAASRGVEVLATSDEIGSEAIAETRRGQLFQPSVIHIEDFDRLVRIRHLEPGQVGALEEGGFDFCWSIGMPGRLRSIEAALAFYEASLAPLKPGGIAVHTLPLNISAEKTTWELPDLVLLRRQDIEQLARRLHLAGHRLLPLNLHPGNEAADARVRVNQGGAPAHRQRHGVVVSTSFGLAIRKAG